jgi:hypothetical protein
LPDIALLPFVSMLEWRWRPVLDEPLHYSGNTRSGKPE